MGWLDRDFNLRDRSLEERRVRVRVPSGVGWEWWAGDLPRALAHHLRDNGELSRAAVG